MQAVGVDLAVPRHAVGVLQVQGAGTDGLDLRAEQLHTGLKAILHEIVVERLAVLRGDLDAGLFHGDPSSPVYVSDSIAHFPAGRKRGQGLVFCRRMWYTAKKPRKEHAIWI